MWRGNWKVEYEPLSPQELAHQLQMRRWAVGIGAFLVVVGIIVFFVSPGPYAPSCTSSGGSTLCTSGGPSPGEILGVVVLIGGLIVIGGGLFAGSVRQRRVVRTNEAGPASGGLDGKSMSSGGGVGTGTVAGTVVKEGNGTSPFCESCGAPLSPRAKFCRSCGEPVTQT
jgi:hypothetical protein